MLVREGDEVALFEKFQVVSFSINSPHNLSQVTAAQSTAGNTECSPSLAQNEMQQVTDTDTISGSHSIHSPPQITEINNQNLPTQKTLP